MSLNNSFDIKKWCRKNQDIAKDLGMAIYKNQRAKTAGEVLAKTDFNDATPEINSIREILDWSLRNKSLARVVFMELYKELK